MKKSQLFLAIFIILIIISSVLGFVSNSNNTPNTNNDINYNGAKFTQDTQGKYQVNVNNNVFIFDYLPNDLSDIELPDFTLNQNKYYLIFNTTEKDDSITYDLNSLGYTLNLLGIKPILACVDEQDCDVNLPIKDCSNDAFYIKKSNINKVYLQDKCVIIEGDNTGLIKSINKINLKLIGII